MRQAAVVDLRPQLGNFLTLIPAGKGDADVGLVAAFFFLQTATCQCRQRILPTHRCRLLSFSVQVWPHVYDHVTVSAVAFQVVMAGLLFVKGGIVFLICLLPLPFIYIAMWASSHDLFRRPLNLLSLRAASDVDRASRQVSQPSCSYQQPCAPLILCQHTSLETQRATFECYHHLLSYH